MIKRIGSRVESVEVMFFKGIVLKHHQLMVYFWCAKQGSINNDRAVVCSRYGQGRVQWL